MPRGVYDRNKAKTRKPRKSKPLTVSEVIQSAEIVDAPEARSLRMVNESLESENRKLRAEVHRLEQLVIQMAEKLL